VLDLMMMTDGVHDYLNDTALQNLMSTASTVSDIVDKALDAESSDIMNFHHIRTMYSLSCPLLIHKMFQILRVIFKISG
jgi:hypothetical protein